MKKIIIVACVVLAFILLFLPYTSESYKAPEPVEPIVEPTKPTVREYARQRVLDTFGGGWVEFERIIQKESNWKVWGDHYPVSKKSTAMGACGFLNGTWKSVGYKKSYDPYKQIDACIIYTKVRYGNPQKALKFHLQNNWW